MPYKNRVKIYKEKTYYHLYARSVDKIPMFKDEMDYKIFLYLLKVYLTKDYKELRKKGLMEFYKTFDSVYGLIQLNAFCLMITHFHLIVKNLHIDGIVKLMRRVLDAYVKYYNGKYQKTGPLIAGGYRAVLIKSPEQLIQVSRYTHLNPVKDKLVKKCVEYKYSSFHNYINNIKTSWLKLDPQILKYTDFKNLEKYLIEEEIYKY